MSENFSKSALAQQLKIMDNIIVKYDPLLNYYRLLFEPSNSIWSENSSSFFIKNKAKHMNAIHRILRNGVDIERVEMLRATFNEAQEINHNLLDDMSDFNKIIVDLSACDYIDSTFFGAMVSAYRKIKAKGGSIALIIGDTFLSRSYIYKDIASIFTVYHSLKEATHVVQNFEIKENKNDYKNEYRKEEPVRIVQAQLLLNPE